MNFYLTCNSCWGPCKVGAGGTGTGVRYPAIAGESSWGGHNLGGKG